MEKTLRELQDEGVGPATAHLRLMKREARCTNCGRRREQKPDKEKESILSYQGKRTYEDEEGEKHRFVTHAWWPLENARPGYRDLCTACAWEKGRPGREVMMERKHRSEAIIEKLAMPMRETRDEEGSYGRKQRH